MKILFYGGWGYGFSQELYDYVFKPMRAKQLSQSTNPSKYVFDVVLNDYDLIWCEGEVSHLACYVHSLSKTQATRLFYMLYRSRRAKIISRFHFPDILPHLKRFRWKAVMALTQSDQTVSVSEYFRREIARLLPAFKDVLDIKIVHNGIDTSRYTPNPSIKENSVVFYLAGTDTRKRLHLLIQAMKHLKDWKLIIGGGPRLWQIPVEEDPTIPPQYRDSRAYWDWCRKLGAPYRDQIEWVGPLPEDAKIRVYQRATAFCLPSRMENWAVTPMEAMSCGTPAIVANVGGLPEFVPKQQLLPTTPKPKQIADRILEASTHPEWGEQNREIIKAYDWKEIRGEVQTVIDEVRKR